MNILVVNCGSSSLKYEVYAMPQQCSLGKGLIERIGLSDGKIKQKAKGKVFELARDIPDHTVAFELMMQALLDKEAGISASVSEIQGVGHRVVHTFLFLLTKEIATFTKEHISLSIILKDNASEQDITRLQNYLTLTDFTKKQEYITKEAALEEHIAGLGEDPTELLGFNPLRASIEVYLNADYAQIGRASCRERV